MNFPNILQLNDAEMMECVDILKEMLTPMAGITAEPKKQITVCNLLTCLCLSNLMYNNISKDVIEKTVAIFCAGLQVFIQNTLEDSDRKAIEKELK